MKALHNTLFFLCLFSTFASAQTTVTYTYDELGRVKTATDSVNGNRAYDYDAAGNRINLGVGSANASPVANPDVASLAVGQTITISPLSNDTDPNGDVLALTTFTVSSSLITVQKISGNRLTIYYPASVPYVTAQTINYNISDGNGGIASSKITVNLL